MTDSIPQAQLRARRRWSWSYLWMLPFIAVLLSAWLLHDAWQQQGQQINIRFQEGHGIKTGDSLRYRGILAGQVEQITLADDLASIMVSVELSDYAINLARAGSQYWIVRPKFDLSGVSGLDTVVGANYLQVLPGQGEPETEFIGLEQPPPIDILEAGGQEITLTTAGKGNLKPGAPISYRQVIIGVIITVDLARDASAVEAKAYIKPEYVNLIRENVQFWRTSGAQVKAGLSGLSVNVDSVHSLVLGGINLAIPPDPGKRVEQDSRFPLHDKPRPEWLSWVPGLSLYTEGNDADKRPPLLSARLRWDYRNLLYLTQNGERHAWLLPAEQGLLGPADVLLPPDDALPDTVKLMLSVDPYTPADSAAMYGDNDALALLPLEHNYANWPTTRTRALDSPEDCLLIAGDDIPPRFISATRMQQQANSATWLIDSAMPFSQRWHGAAVITVSDNKLIGILLVDEDNLQVSLLPLAGSE